MKPPIPVEVVKAVAYQLDPKCWDSYSKQPIEFKRCMDVRRDKALKLAKEVCQTMIIMWPGVQHRIHIEQAIILPLTKIKKETQPGAFDYWPAEEEGSWGDD